MNNTGSLDGLHDIVANVTGPTFVRPWSGDLESAVSTYFSLRESQLGGDEAVFMIDHSALRSAKKFIDDHYTQDEFIAMEKDWLCRLDLKR